MSQTAAETLADHYAKLRVEDIPRKHVDDAKVLVGDYIGVALGGSTTDSGKIAAQFAVEVGGKTESTLIGQSGRTNAMHAALANAIASHSIELDDVDHLALFHFSPPVVSAALAVAESEGASGAAFIAAVVAGCEMMARASNAMNMSLRNRGFHTTPTCGVFGATVAAAMLMKLNRDQMVSALGLAGSQSSGLMEMYGPSMQKRFNPGPAARNGVTAAALARMGFTGAATIFDGERGFGRAFSDDFKVGELTKNLGKEWPLFFEFKPYSCARPIHNAIDCAIEIRNALKEPLSAITAISVRRHPDWAAYHLNPTPKTYHEAQVSLPFSVAIALREGAALPPQYSNDKLSDPEMLRLSKMTKIESDASLPRGVSCLMTIETKGGATFRSQIDYPRGSIQNPMTREEMHHKVHMLGDEVLGQSTLSKVIETVEGVEKLGKISELTSLLQRKK